MGCKPEISNASRLSRAGTLAPALLKIAFYQKTIRLLIMIGQV
jgi:hypothetical protein